MKSDRSYAVKKLQINDETTMRIEYGNIVDGFERELKKFGKKLNYSSLC